MKKYILFGLISFSMIQSALALPVRGDGARKCSELNNFTLDVLKKLSIENWVNGYAYGLSSSQGISMDAQILFRYVRAECIKNPNQLIANAADSAVILLTNKK